MSTRRGQVDVQALMPLAAGGRMNIINESIINKIKIAQVSILIFCVISALFWMHEVYKSPILWGEQDEVQSQSSSVYKGKPWVSSQTVSKVVLAETKFARCDMHTVRLEDGTLIKDWLFFEERSAINVIVINRKGQFVMFKQTKYALEGETFSPVGGFIDDGETPIQAAKREVKEELGLASRASINTQNTNDAQSINDPDWVSLGSYRTAVNRGAGYTHLFLLKDAVPILPKGGTAYFNGSGDSESQKIRFLSKNQVLDAMSKAQFQEVKWTAALGLSLLHLENKISNVA